MKTLEEVLTVTPYEYQNKGIYQCIKHNYMIIGDEMGLGKSLQALAISALYEEKTLVVCPAYLRLNWANEFNKFCKIKKDIKIMKTARDFKDLDHDVFIMSYSMLKHAREMFFECPIVIADEAHYLKSVKAKRTKMFTSYTMDFKPDRMILLTGTPIDKNVYEFYSLLSLCSYNPMENSGVDVNSIFSNTEKFNDYFSYRVERDIKSKYGRRVKLVSWRGVRRLEELKNLLKGKFIRRKACNVLELPPLIHKEILMGTSMETDDTLLREFNDNVDKLSSKTKSDSAYIKAPMTAKYVSELLEEGLDSVIVFTDHLNPIPIIYNTLNKKYKCKVITGSISPDIRDEIVTSLQNGDIQVLIATLGAASVGFNMTKSSNIVINDLSWRPAVNNQAIKRIHRIGQKNKCIIHYILGSTVDKRITNLLQEKARNINHIL